MNDVSTPAETTTAAQAVEEELPTHCDVPWCGQPLLLRRPARTRCGRCQMGRTRKPVDRAEQTAEEAMKVVRGLLIIYQWAKRSDVAFHLEASSRAALAGYSPGRRNADRRVSDNDPCYR